MKRRSSGYNERKQKSSYFQKEIALKLEDKILLGIGGFFLIILIAFMSFANSIFKSHKIPQKSPIQESLIQREETASEMDAAFKNPFKEFEEGFQKLGEVFEENQKRNNESFQKAVNNFHNHFEQAEENFRKGK
ncbi:MAG: hypothetical protein BGO67_10435 [Alphaproteobacteria bacterium 41-28]|nr:MAG: hypothetical protein BGO67_10435 [Alphaproteobacteria bacterium 41-28]